MICGEVRRVAYFFLDGELGDPNVQEVTQHLDSCGDCKGRVSIHQKLRMLIRKKLTRYVAPDGFHARIMEAVRSGRAARGEADLR